MPGEVARAEEAGPLRDQEGLVVGLYRHLWLKNQKGETCDVNIPHTVIFQNQEPVAWYFTSLKECKIMRKRKPSMGPVMAEAFMTTRASQPEVCAWFNGNMTTSESNVLKTQRTRTRDSLAEDEVEVVLQARALEHLTYDRVQLMLDPGPYRLVSEEHVYDGVMQKFLEPRNPNDFIIRAIWSPSACIFEKRTNKHRLLPRPDLGPHQEIPPLVDRIASFNSSMWLHEHTPISTKALKTRLLTQCDAVAHHLKDVTNGLTIVKRMELFFKIDTQHRIWLLFCSSLQLERPAMGDPRYPRVSQQGEAVQGPASFMLKDPTQPKEEQANEEEQGNCLCAMTGKIFPRCDRIHVTYKLIMQHWFKKCAELASECDRSAALDSIPPAIRRSNPNMSREFYLRCRSQPFFMLNIADVSPDADEELLRAAYDDLAESLGHPVGLRSTARGRRSSALASSSRPMSVDPGGKGRRPQSRQDPGPAAAAPPLPGGQLPEISGAEPQDIPSALLPKGSTPRPSSSSQSSTRAAWAAWHKQQLPCHSHRPASTPTSAAAAAKRPFGAACGDRGRDSDPGSTWPPRCPAAPGPQQLPLEEAPRPATALGSIAEEASLRLLRPSDVRRSFLLNNYQEQRVLPPPRPQPRKPPSEPAAGLQLELELDGPGAARLHPADAELGGSGSFRSSPSLRTSHELQTLQEISRAYAQAEQLTQQLLSQAHQLLQSPPESVPESPMSSRQAAATINSSPAPSHLPGGVMRSPLPATPPEEELQSDWTISLTGSRRSSGETLPVASSMTTPYSSPGGAASNLTTPYMTPSRTLLPPPHSSSKCSPILSE